MYKIWSLFMYLPARFETFEAGDQEIFLKPRHPDSLPDGRRVEDVVVFTLDDHAVSHTRDVAQDLRRCVGSIYKRRATVIDLLLIRKLVS